MIYLDDISRCLQTSQCPQEIAPRNMSLIQISSFIALSNIKRCKLGAKCGEDHLAKTTVATPMEISPFTILLTAEVQCYCITCTKCKPLPEEKCSSPTTYVYIFDPTNLSSQFLVDALQFFCLALGV